MKKRNGELEVKVWQECGPADWRAAVFEDRTRYASRIGRGATRDEALENLRELVACDSIKVEWLPLAVARIKAPV